MKKINNFVNRMARDRHSIIKSMCQRVNSVSAVRSVPMTWPRSPINRDLKHRKRAAGPTLTWGESITLPTLREIDSLEYWYKRLFGPSRPLRSSVCPYDGCGQTYSAATPSHTVAVHLETQQIAAPTTFGFS
jgi:hypothetical protein